jgi:hypothetical protein
MKCTKLISVVSLMASALLGSMMSGCVKNPVEADDKVNVDNGRHYSVVAQTTSSKPIPGASIAIRLAGALYQASTDQTGRVDIPIPGSVALPDYVVVTVDHSSYMPEAVTVSGGQNASVTRTVTCTTSPGKVLLREVRLHHLGDNHFTGDPNSQLQMSSEGTVMKFQFTLSSVPSTMPYLRLYGRGIQYTTRIKVNGVQVSSLSNSPTNGDLGCYSGLLGGTASSALHTGVNTLAFETVYDSSISDYDDIEFCSLLLYYK